MEKEKKTADRLRTRRSLLSRIKNPDDRESWQDFANTYSGLILGVAIKSGLSQEEAKDALQETLISVSKSIKDFKYDPSRSFKAWLLQATRWRINDQFKKRSRFVHRPSTHADDSGRTKTVERVPSPTGYDLEANWNTEWQEHVVKTLMDRVRDKINPKHYQIFHAYVTKDLPAETVAKTLGVTTSQVFTVKKRVLALVQKEATRLEMRGM